MLLVSLPWEQRSWVTITWVALNRLKQNLDTVVLPYGFTVASPWLPTRVCKSTKTHIDYILPENIDDEKKCF